MENPRKIGRYEVVEELGHGAMGTVYRAKDPVMNRTVALKTIISLVLASERGAEFRERFYREARAAGGLQHPGIVSVFDVGEDEGSPFLVMEFVNGQTLAHALKGGERMSTDRICEIGQQIAEALGYAHRHGVVHRDIKPANILMTSAQTHGIERPKITDFGVAKLAEGHTTMTGQMLGTPAFMPPEQFTGAPIDGRADLFSLGVVLYWMTTGEQPFPGESMTAVSYKVVHTEPPPPQKLNPSIPSRLEKIILKCLAKSPDDRYQTGEDLARDLAEARVRGGVNSTQAAAAAPAMDPEATFVEAVRTTATPRPPAAQSTQAPPPAAIAASVPRSGAKSPLLLVVAGLAVVVIAGGWFALRKPQAPPQQAAQPAAAPAEAPAPSVPATPPPAPAPTASPAPATPAAALPPASPVATKAAAAKATKASLDATKATADTAAATPEAPIEAAALGFDPKALNPKENARLKIEADQMPAGLDFAVEMNGKTYVQGSTDKDKEFDNLFVPPGVQEFRVVARSGSTRKVSNTVSMEFKAKKKNAMKIELRTQGMPEGSGVPQGLYPNAQLVVTLK